MEWNSQTILTIFVAITGVAVLLQAGVLFAIVVAIRKATKQSLELAEDVHTKVMPTVQSASELIVRLTPLVEKLGPHILSISENLVEVSNDLRDEAAEIRRASSDITFRLQRQTKRVDAMLTTSLDRVEVLSDLVESAVTTPARQANGIVLAFKAAVETYFGGIFKPRLPRPSRDNETFI